jgi:NAD(P)-dependent dehydrogenase (short-subunit alcohol dehydrogenase family)
MRLMGRRAVVTGAGSTEESVGVGAAIAIAFAREGARVWVIDRNEDRATATCQWIEKEGGRASPIQGDVTEIQECERIAQTASESGHFPVDVLVNNVGISCEADSLEKLDLEQWQRVIDTNLKSAVLMTRALILPMAAAGKGVIVNIASIAALRAHGNGFAYGASKAGMIAFTRDVAVRYGRDGIRANAIAPGHLYTPMVAARLSEEQRRTRRDIAPLGIEGVVWDVAAAALFLASDEARFITGTCLPVDGGVTAVGPLAATRFLDPRGSTT